MAIENHGTEPWHKWRQDTVNGYWYRYIPGGGWFIYEPYPGAQDAPPDPYYNGVGVRRTEGGLAPAEVLTYAAAQQKQQASQPAAPPAQQQPPQSAPPPTSAITPGTDAAGDGTVWDATSQMLVDAGLSGLIPWYRQKLTEGASPYEIAILIQEQPAFKNRFKAIEERKNLGLPAISPQDVLAYERQASGLMRAAGLPKGFYNHYDDYKDLLVNDVSLAELAERIQEGYARVTNATQQLKDAFYEYFGSRGMDNLAAYFLDPERATPLLLQQVEGAAIGGVGKEFGYDLTEDRAMHFAKAQIREGQARQAFMNLTEIRGMFDESYSEGQDLRLDVEGLDALLGVSAEALRRLEDRRNRRVAQFGGTTGGAAVDRFGFHFGAARA